MARAQGSAWWQLAIAGAVGLGIPLTAAYIIWRSAEVIGAHRDKLIPIVAIAVLAGLVAIRKK